MHATVPEEHRNEAPFPHSSSPCFTPGIAHTPRRVYLSLLASRSDSSRHRMSSSRTVFPALASQLSRFFGFRLSHRTWALDVADDGAGGVVHELDADLGHATAGAWKISPLTSSSIACAFSLSESWNRTGAAEDAGDLDELDGNPFAHTLASVSLPMLPPGAGAAFRRSSANSLGRVHLCESGIV